MPRKRKTEPAAYRAAKRAFSRLLIDEAVPGFLDAPQRRLYALAEEFLSPAIDACAAALLAGRAAGPRRRVRKARPAAGAA